MVIEEYNEKGILHWGFSCILNVMFVVKLTEIFWDIWGCFL